jgi:hypothetical protein
MHHSIFKICVAESAVILLAGLLARVVMYPEYLSHM